MCVFCQLQEESGETRWKKNIVDGGGDCAHYDTTQKVRDQPGGPRQLTAAAFSSLVRMVVVVMIVETVSGVDSRKEGSAENGIDMSGGTLFSFGIPLLLSSRWIVPRVGV